MVLAMSQRPMCALLVGGLLLAACSRQATTQPPPPAPAPAAERQAQVLPGPPVVGRAELLAAIDAAAAAAAAGEPAPEAVTALAGRRFVLRLPFGCFGPAGPAEAVGYAYDPKTRIVRMSAKPQAWTDAAWARALVGTQQTEAIEGFWVRRPWMRSEACPAATPAPSQGAGAQPPAEETVGLAQVFDEGGSRLLRRDGRGYEATRKIEADQAPAPGSWRLVLQGRIAPPGARPSVACNSAHPERRPVCLVRVEIDRVAFETAEGEVLSEWKS